MAETPKLAMEFPCEVSELEEDRKITVSDRLNKFQYSAGKSDSFVIDMESMSSGSNRDVSTPTSRISRSLSRKGLQRVGGDGGGCGNEKKINSNMVPARRGDTVATGSPNAPKVGHGKPEKPTGMSDGAIDHASNPQGLHQITITANNMNTNAENQLSSRKNSFRRHSQSWFFNPKRIVILFATLSSMGTLILIYFTLTINQPNADDYALDWQQ